MRKTFKPDWNTFAKRNRKQICRMFRDQPPVKDDASPAKGEKQTKADFA